MVPCTAWRHILMCMWCSILYIYLNVWCNFVSLYMHNMHSTCGVIRCMVRITAYTCAWYVIHHVPILLMLLHTFCALQCMPFEFGVILPGHDKKPLRTQTFSDQPRDQHRLQVLYRLTFTFVIYCITVGES